MTTTTETTTTEAEARPPLVELRRAPAPAACQEHGRWGCVESDCLVPHHVIDLRHL
ncbi:MAG TPA: hypothetical protein VFA11_07205 [Acidimicrobiales bacterium]|nr:hypothetical protein [Acidimicrobiales bacterium]